MRKEQVQKLKLVIQAKDTVMVAAVEAPVMEIRTSGGFVDDRHLWIPTLIMGMNFLRCGAPEVTLYSEFLEDLEKDSDKEGMSSLEKSLNLFLSHFGDAEYYFTVDVKHGGGIIHMARVKYP